MSPLRATRADRLSRPRSSLHGLRKGSTSLHFSLGKSRRQTVHPRRFGRTGRRHRDTGNRSHRGAPPRWSFLGAVSCERLRMDRWRRHRSDRELRRILASLRRKKTRRAWRGDSPRDARTGDFRARGSKRTASCRQRRRRGARPLTSRGRCRADRPREARARSRRARSRRRRRNALSLRGARKTNREPSALSRGRCALGRRRSRRVGRARGSISTEEKLRTRQTSIFFSFIWTSPAQ